MARKQYPTSFKQWFGKLAIILHGADKKPVVVCIRGVNLHGVLIAEAINTNNTHFANPLRCIEYSERLYKKLLTQSHYRRAVGEFEWQKKKLIGSAPRPNKRCPTEVSYE